MGARVSAQASRVAARERAPQSGSHQLEQDIEIEKQDRASHTQKKKEKFSFLFIINSLAFF
jgi:hypothetical protein